MVSLSSWWDALLFGDRYHVAAKRRPHVDEDEELLTFHRRDASTRADIRVIEEQRQKFIDASKMIRWGFGCGPTSPSNGMPDASTWMGVTTLPDYAANEGPMIYIFREICTLLLDPNCSVEQRLLATLGLAVVVCHELSVSDCAWRL